jgi:ArsR family transcriptional regulator, virulence genes transcriptional regulator
MARNVAKSAAAAVVPLEATEPSPAMSGALADLEPKAENVAVLLSAMANSKRLLILCALMHGERQAGDLASIVGLTFSAASQHLARMRLQGLVATRRDGQAIHYRLESDEVRAVLETLYRVFCAPDPDAAT